MYVLGEWRDYDCSDYFDSQLAETGWWDSGGQYWYIEPAHRIREDRERGFLIVGGPGVDGIEWGYRRGHAGIWAFYPIEAEFRCVAQSALDLREGYAAGLITI